MALIAIMISLFVSAAFAQAPNVATADPDPEATATPEASPEATPLPPPAGFGSGDISPTENTDVSTMITTGCGYDAWTGAVMRTVTDIEVPGAASSHGLKVVRTYTSSTGIGWSLSWQWQIHARPFTNDGSYMVNFPDGRAEQFYPPSIPGETAYRAGRATRDRLFINSPGSSNRSADLYMEDGSHVHFSWVIDNSSNEDYLIDYFAPESFTDPYGQVTTLIYSTYIPNDAFAKHLTKVIDPSGRSLTYNYDPLYPGRLASITASNGQSVTYAGFLDSLPSATYNDGTAALYTYGETTYKNNKCPQNTCHPYKLFTASDVRLEGPMRAIMYTYQSNAEFQGEVSQEQHPSGLEVSKFVSTNGRGSSQATNTEFRGDGPSRTFSMTRNGKVTLLKEKSDFRGVIESYQYDSNLNLSHLTDRNGHTTDFTNEPILGRPLVVTHPGCDFTCGSSYPSTTRSYIYSDSANPYYISSVKDDRNNPTTYQRDPTYHRITEIDYPDGGTETFLYNAKGQVTRHKRQNGAYEFFDYDATWRLVVKWNPVASSIHPPSSSPLKTTYEYYEPPHPWGDRVLRVTDARGNRTEYEYDKTFDANGAQTNTPCPGRGLITKISYPDDKHDGTYPNGTSMSYVYDVYGNLLTETQDQLGETTKYTYDEYNRLKTMRVPPSDAIPSQRPTVYDYTPNRADPPNGINPLSHTSNSVWHETSPSLVVTTRVFDENFRLSSETVGSQDPTVAATSYYGYDGVGNCTYVTDPRGSGPQDATYTTYTDYDTRNRKTQVRPPLPPNGVAENTQWEYDPNGNMTKEVRPDLTVETRDYDTMNRMIRDTLPKEPGDPVVTATTLLDYYPAGTLKTVTDAKSRVTTFFYNENDLKSQMNYPPNGQGIFDYEAYEYDGNYNLINRRATSGIYQVFEYDPRNRQSRMGWFDGKTTSTAAHLWANGYYDNTYAYDASGRMTTAANANSTVTRQWDQASRLLTEKQTFSNTSFNGPLLKYFYRHDGKVSRLYVGPGETYDFLLGYDGLARLSTLTYNPNTYFDHEYAYDRASNVISRMNNLNGTNIILERDNLNRITARTINIPGATFSREVYGFDARDRVVDVRRDETLTNDHFGYNQMGEMTLAEYGTAVTPSPTPSITPTPTPTPTATPTPTPTQVAPIYIYDLGYQQGDPMRVYMETTPDARILYTQGFTCPNDPTYDENGDPTGETKDYAVDPPYIPVGQVNLFSAIGLKDGLAPSEINACFSDDNVQQRPADGPARTVTYQWDKVGNRGNISDSAVNGGAVQPYTSNNLNQYKQVNGQSVLHEPAHGLSSYDGVIYSYVGDTYLAQASAGPSIYTLYYDALGRCVKRVRSEMGVETTTYYHFDGDHWILEYRPDGTVQSNILYGNGVDEIIGRHNEESGVATNYNQWPYPDRNNNTSVVTGDGGTLLEYYRYDAFGQPTIYDPATDAIRTTSAIANRFLFTGREWNPAQKFYEYRNRAYSPSLGRFMSEDPKGFDAGDYNLYRYVGNDPLDRSDPMGLYSWGEFGTDVAKGTGYGLTGAAIVAFAPEEAAGVLIAAGAYGLYKTGQTLLNPNVSKDEKISLSVQTAVGVGVGGLASRGMSSVAAGEGAAIKFSIPSKIAGQMEDRGWTSNSLNSTINRPSLTAEATNKATGGGATAYFNRDGSYVVRDNATGKIIQVSDRNDPNWKPDSSIKLPQARSK